MLKILSPRSMALMALTLLLAACPAIEEPPNPPDPVEDPRPGALTNLAVALEGTNFELTWTNPADEDFAAALLVMRPGEAGAFSPTAGEEYTLGDEVAEGTTVIHVSPGSSATVAVPDIGAPFHFAGWAVDAALQHSETAATTEIDPIPGNVADLTATPTDEISLAWTNPLDTDLAGILVVMRVGSPVAFTPEAGATYSLDEDLGDGQTVLSVDVAATSSIVTTPGCAVHFAAWAWDEAGQWSAEAAAASTARIDLGTQTATLEYDIAAQTVTVLSQPADLTVTAAWQAVARQERGNPFQDWGIDMTVQNDGCRLLFNLKAVNDSMTNGTQLVPEGGGEERGGPPTSTFHGNLWFDDDKAFTYFGPESMLPGGSVTRPLVFRHESGFTDAVTVELHFIDAPAVYGGNYGGDFVVLDTSMSGMAHRISFEPSGERGGSEGPGQQLREAVISPDGRLIFAGEKRTPFVNVIDTSMLEATGGVDLSAADNGEGSVGGVALSADGSMLYVVFNDGTHWHGWSPSNDNQAMPTAVHVIEFETEALTEVRRTTLIADDAHSRTGRSVALRADGGRLGVLLSDKEGERRELWFVDVASFEAVDTDTETEGVQPVTLPEASVGQAEYLTWSDTSDVLSVGYNDHKGDDRRVNLDLVDGGTFAVTNVVPAMGGAAASVPTVHDGSLYYTARKGEQTGPLSIISFADGSQTTPELFMPWIERGKPESGASATGVIFEPSGDRYWVLAYEDAWAVDAATNELIDTDGDEANGASAIEMAEEMRAHVLVGSPH